MAMKRSQRQYSKKLIFNLLMIVLLSGFLLLGWSLTLWARFGFEQAFESLHRLSTQQRAVLIPFNTPAINTSWLKLPTADMASKIQTVSNALPHPNNEFILLTYDALQIAKQFWQLVGMTAQVMLIKLTILLAAIPLFTLAMTAGLIDGLNQRAIRTASLVRESSYVFHQLNRLFKRGLLVLLGLWCAVPLCITPALMLVPVSVLLSVMVSVTACRFKKYL